MLHLVTGYAGVEHVTSNDIGSFNAALMGNGEFVLERGNKFGYEIVSNNKIKINDGDMLVQGRHIRLKENDAEELQFDTGSQGKKRHDLIVVTYEKNPETGVELAKLEVIKGIEDVSATDPTITTGNILTGSIKHQVKLYRVKFDGIDLVSVDKLFSEVETLESMKLGIVGEVEADVNGALQDFESEKNVFFQNATNELNSLAEQWALIAASNTYTIQTNDWVEVPGETRSFITILAEGGDLNASGDMPFVAFHESCLEVLADVDIIAAVVLDSGVNKLVLKADSKPNETISADVVVLKASNTIGGV